MLRNLALAIAIVTAAGGCSGPRPAPGLSADEVSQANRAVGLMGRYDFERARDIFARLAAAHRDRLDLQIDLAIATLNRQNTGDEAAARAIFDRVLVVDTANSRAHYGVGLLLLHDGKAHDALPHFMAAAQGTAPDAYAAYFVAQSRFQDGDLAGALTWYERALADNPRLRSAAYGVFRTLQQLGRTADAERMLVTFRALEVSPQSEVVEFKYTRMGRLAEVSTVDRLPAARAAKPAGAAFDRTILQLSPPVRAIAWRRFDASTPASITAADIDGDGAVDLFIADAINDNGRIANAVLLNRGAAGFAVDLDHPLASVTGVSAAVWGDVDNDGLLDVYLCRQAGNQLWRQTGKGVWADVTATARAAGGSTGAVDGALIDADHDGDLDVLLVRSDGSSELLNNNGDGTFRPLAGSVGLSLRTAFGLVIADLDADRDADLLFLSRTTPHQLLLNDLTWKYHGDRAFDRLLQRPVSAAVAADLDADGYPEIYAAGSEGLERWARTTSGEWDVRSIAGTAQLAAARQLAVTDVDGDGRLEIVAAGTDGRWQALAIDSEGRATTVFAETSDATAGWAAATLDNSSGPSIVALPAQTAGPPILWRPGAGRFPFVTIAPTGQDRTSARLRSNRSGIGAQIGARVDSRWTAIATLRPQSGPGQSLQPIAIGTGGEPQIDFVAITWSDGVLQTELALAPGPVRPIEETERQLSSCPVLFAFDGRHFAFVTDLLGVGGIGTPSRPGVYDPPHPTENVLLPEGLLQPQAERQDRLTLKITEPMEEVAYLDSVQLVAYDVPPGWQMALDERKSIAPPDATGEPRFYRVERLPIKATDEQGRDIVSTVARADNVAVQPGTLDPRFIGLSTSHHIVLGFDSPLDAEAGDAMLVADGWVEYPYAQTLFAAWQAGAAYHAPTIEARGTDGRWRALRREFGYPAGMARRMSVPIGPLPAGTRELRISTNQEIYWDRLSVAYSTDCPLTTRQVLALGEARLARAGFAVRDLAAGRRPTYDYDRRIPIWDARYASGTYTAEGDVRDLLGSRDDAVVVLGPGEEVHLEFATPLSPVKAGWTRRFVLETRGWCKDMDLYTKDGNTVEPLPGKRSAAAEELQRRFTTRYESGR